jgi:hypothetical protein
MIEVRAPQGRKCPRAEDARQMIGDLDWVEVDETAYEFYYTRRVADGDLVERKAFEAAEKKAAAERKAAERKAAKAEAKAAATKSAEPTAPPAAEPATATNSAPASAESSAELGQKGA